MSGAHRMGWLAGLLIAAPFAAVMSTVDSFLLMISSALVRGIYQRNVNPKAKEKNIKTLSYVITLVAGLGALLGAMNPPEFLQDIIVYTGSGLAACFLGPTLYALYWPRANAAGCIAGMAAGFLAHLGSYAAGAFVHSTFFIPYRPLDLDPIILGLLASLATTSLVRLRTARPGRMRLYRHRGQIGLIDRLASGDHGPQHVPLVLTQTIHDLSLYTSPSPRD